MLRFWLIVFNAVGLPSHVAVVCHRVSEPKNLKIRCCCRVTEGCKGPQLNLQEPNGLPKISLLPGINNYLSEFVPLPFNERPPSWQYASTLIFTTLFRSRCKVDIIALGPLTNLAQVIQERPTIFYKKVKRLYFSGGDVVPRDAAPTTKVWPFFRGWHLYRQSVRHFLECLQ